MFYESKEGTHGLFIIVKPLNMKTNYLLMLLFCGACFSCNAPQQDKQKSDSTKAKENMTNVELREKIVMASTLNAP